MSNVLSPSARVSVIMSVYNGMPLVADAIESILSQTMSDFEFIIVNDGSTDGTLGCLQCYAARDTRILIVNQENMGLTKSLSRAISLSGAPIVARMDADDLSMPERLSCQLALLDERSDIVAASCGIENVSSELGTLGVNRKRFSETSLPLLMAFSNIISGHGQMAFRRAAYDVVGGYDCSLRYAQDYDLWCRLLVLGPIGEAEGVLYRFRVGHGSISTRNRDKQREIAVEIAATQYQRITGSCPPYNRVGDVMDWWVPSTFAERSAVRQFKAFLHVYGALRSYFDKNMLGAIDRDEVQAYLSELLLAGRFNLSRSAIFKRGMLVALACAFAPRKVLVRLGSKLRG